MGNKLTIEQIAPSTWTRDAVFDRASARKEDRTIDLAFSSEAPYSRWWGVETLSHESGAVNLARLNGGANLLVMPGIDAANISYNLLKTAAGNNVAIGPVLLGAARPVHILTPSATVRRIVNMTAWTVVDANSER